MNLELCDMINHDGVNSVELIRGIKKRIMLKSPRIQYLGLVLLETVVKNCEKAFSEVAAESVLDEIVKLIDDPQTAVNNRNKSLTLIEAWGESSNELRYLPVYEQTYKLNSQRKPLMWLETVLSFLPLFSKMSCRSLCLLHLHLDDLTTTLVQQCRQSQFTVQRIIETAGDNEALLFEALNINDEVLKVLTKYEDMKTPSVASPQAEPAMIPVAAEPDDSPLVGKEDALVRNSAGPRSGSQGGQNDERIGDLDEMIFGMKSGGSSEEGHGAKKQTPRKDDLISF